MAPESSFAEVMARLRAGDSAAAALVFDRFAHRLIALARSRLGSPLRQKVAPEDVLQSVFRSFFVRQAEGQVKADNWESLWGMLVVITVRKCGRRVTYFRAARRDIRREAADGSLPDLAQTVDPEPTPEEAVMLTETVEQLMRQLDARQREILTQTLQGHSVAEISVQLGCTERTVYRVLERVKDWLQAAGADDE
jgi:RNA polymerase sigma-70 factor (ECF subfamily)